MGGSLFREATPALYFKELIEAAVARQKLEVGELTSYYLVNLLCGYVRVEQGVRGFDDAPLAMQLAQALDTGGREQRARLRSLGDVSLFISGFFSDSLSRKTVDLDYYVSMGEYAYASLSRSEEEMLGDVFRELAAKFCSFVDVLGEVSERSALTSNADLLRLYERWLRTGSRRDSQRLAEKGIVATPGAVSRLIN